MTLSPLQDAEGGPCGSCSAATLGQVGLSPHGTLCTPPLLLRWGGGTHACRMHSASPCVLSAAPQGRPAATHAHTGALDGHPCRPTCLLCSEYILRETKSAPLARGWAVMGFLAVDAAGSIFARMCICLPGGSDGPQGCPPPPCCHSTHVDSFRFVLHVLTCSLSQRQAVSGRPLPWFPRCTCSPLGHARAFPPLLDCQSLVLLSAHIR